MAKEATINDFGLLIAYVLPGFAALWAATFVTDAVGPWFAPTPADSPTVGGFLFMTVASVAAGITVSTLRWLVIDPIHHHTGIHPPRWDFSLLRESVAAFGVVVDHYYRYYQFYANTLVSLLLVFAARRWSIGATAPVDGADGLLLGLMAVFFLGSRDSLRRYYTRGGQVLRRQVQREAGERRKRG